MSRQQKQTAKLENWAFYLDANSRYQAPELMTTRLGGTVYGHPCLEDGKQISTSTLVNVPIPCVEGSVVETLNTLYTLGKVHPKFQEYLDLMNKGG